MTASPAGLAAGTYTGVGDRHRGRRERLAEDDPGHVHGRPRRRPASSPPTGSTSRPGATVADASGSGNAGTVNGATRTANGRFGGALSFDGVNDRVNVPHSASLALTNAMTLEAWVAPDVLGGWRTVLLKERAGGLSYALYGSDDQGRPTVFGRAASEVGTTGAAALGLGAWTHIAGTYDGSHAAASTSEARRWPRAR